MPLEQSAFQFWRESRAARPTAANDLAGGGGDGHPPGMETEVALLKQRADQSDQRLARIEDKLDRIGEVLHQMPTKATVWTALGTGGGIALAILGIFVAILAYLQDQHGSPAAPPAPGITLNLPAWPTPPAAAPAPAPVPRP